MSIAAVIVGINGWKEYTQPLLGAFNEYDPGIDVVCVDNQSDPPYPTDRRTFRCDTRCGYGDAINQGIQTAGKHDWYLVMNNDIELSGSISHKINELDPDKLYGFDLHHIHNVPDSDYLQGWALIISHKVWSTVGLFDEKFEVTWFDDVDYSWRAKQAGFELERLPRGSYNLLHFGKDRPDWTEFRSQHRGAYDKNRAYLLVKHGLLKGDQ